MKKKLRFFLILLIAFFLILGFDMRLKTVKYTVKTQKVTQTIRIALLTDLHSDKYGENQEVLISAVNEQDPDVVLLGGDIFDDKKSHENTEKTLLQLSEKYPCYYVTGNHEYWSEDIGAILEIVESYGIKKLSGDCDTIEINGQTINICGVDDPKAVLKNGRVFEEQLELAHASVKEEYFTVLLTHRPEYVRLYLPYNYDLVLSGHAHGGQLRIPGVLNGIYAPNQGFFPKYAGGRYDFENMVHIVSRGLARESTPIPRFYNRPELVIVDIVRE